MRDGRSHYWRGSTGDLRKAMRFLQIVEREFPDAATVKALGAVIDRLDRRIGPARRELGFPRLLGGRVYDAALREAGIDPAQDP